MKGLSITTKRVKERTQQLPIEFSETRGGPIGPNVRAFVDEVVLFTRKWALLIGVASWKNIKDNVKKEIATEILVRAAHYYSHCFLVQLIECLSICIL